MQISLQRLDGAKQIALVTQKHKNRDYVSIFYRAISIACHSALPGSRHARAVSCVLNFHDPFSIIALAASDAASPCLNGSLHIAMPINPSPGLDPSAWLAAIVDGSQDAIVSKSLDGTILSWNSAAQKLFGYSAQEAIGKSITLIIPDDRLHEEDAIIANIKAGLRTEHFETVRERKDGSLIDVSLTVSPVRDAHGRLLGASKVARDITQARQMAQQQSLLLQEMNHRIKNLFALANGLVATCRREADTVDGLVRDLQSRLMALARAHDTTVYTPQANGLPAAIALSDLLATILMPYRGASGPDVLIGGSDVRIGPRSLASFALLLHELATNSAKYGALRCATGVLAIEMECSDEELRLLWRETGQDDRLSPPEAEGFGSRLQAMTVRALKASIHRDWQADQLLIKLRFPTNVLER